MEIAYPGLIPSKAEVEASKQPLKQTTLDFGGNPPPPAEPVHAAKPQFVVPGFWFAREFRIQHNSALAWLQHRIDKLCLSPELDYCIQLRTDPVWGHSFYEPRFTIEAANHITTWEGSERGRFVADLVRRRFGDGKRPTEQAVTQKFGAYDTPTTADNIEARLDDWRLAGGNQPLHAHLGVSWEGYNDIYKEIKRRRKHQAADGKAALKFGAYDTPTTAYNLYERIEECYASDSKQSLSAHLGLSYESYERIEQEAEAYRQLVAAGEGAAEAAVVPAYPSQPWDLTAMPVDPETKAVANTITAEVYADPPDLDAPIQIQVLSGTQFPVDARPLHAELEIGRIFAAWIQDRIDKFQLVKDVDYEVISHSGNNPLGGRPTIDYHLTILAARMLAADVNSEKGRKVIKFLVARSSELDRLEAQQPALPATLDLTDPLALANLAAALTAHTRALTAEKEQLLLANTALAEDVENAERVARQADEAAARAELIAIHALAKKEASDRTADEATAVRALEAKAIPVSEWFKNTVQDHGMKEIIGRLMLVIIGLLTRTIVKGCRKTKEAKPTDEGDKYMMMSSSMIDKTITTQVLIRDEHGVPILDADGLYQYEEKVVPVLDSDGNQVVIESRVVKVLPHKTADLMHLVLNSPECLIHRLIQHHFGSLIQKRLDDRVSLMWHNNRGWDELCAQRYLKAIRIAEVGPAAWVVECFVQRHDKERSQHVAQGRGWTLQDAYEDLAFHYYKPCDKPWMGDVMSYLVRSLIELRKPDEDDDSTDTTLTQI